MSPPAQCVLPVLPSGQEKDRWIKVSMTAFGNVPRFVVIQTAHTGTLAQKN
jgi:hypothetical protein